MSGTKYPGFRINHVTRGHRSEGKSNYMDMQCDESIRMECERVTGQLEVEVVGDCWGDYGGDARCWRRRRYIGGFEGSGNCYVYTCQDNRQ